MFGALAVGALVGTLGLIPYVQSLGIEIPLLALIQPFVLSLALAALGLWLGGKVELGAPILRAWLAGHPGACARFRAYLPTNVLAGAGAGIAILALESLVFAPRLGTPGGEWWASLPPAAELWQAAGAGFLASFYGGIVEEIMLRLGAMTVLVWIGTKLARRDRPGARLMWVCILLAAVLFGVGHLPATALLAPLTPLVVARGLLLNGIGAVIFGYLYWRRGLESAMVAHFAADIVLHVLVPLGMLAALPFVA